MYWQLFLTSLAVVVSRNNALECYQCQNLRSSSKDSALSNIIADNANPACDNPDSGNVPTVTCPRDGGMYKCGLVEGTITGKILFADISVTVTARDCFETRADDGCHTADKNAKSLMNDVLELLTGARLDGQVCYCSDDYCVAGCEFSIGDTCIPLPAWAVYILGAVGLVIVALLLSCCCCCCCMPCRSHSRPAPPVAQTSTITYMMPARPGAEVTTPVTYTTSGAPGAVVGSCSNPIYDGSQKPGQMI